MGIYKRTSDIRSEVRRYNAAQRNAQKWANMPSSQLIHLNTLSEIERFEVAKDVDHLIAFNKEVAQWQDSVSAQLKASVGTHSSRVAEGLKPNTYTDKYGLINRLGFSFPRHGIYLHQGASRGHGGFTGSKWTYVRRINGIDISTGIIRHTNPKSLGLQNNGRRKAIHWFDPIIQARLPELADICMRHFDTMAIDATHIFIAK